MRTARSRTSTPVERHERVLYRLFRLSLWGKGLLAVAELVSALVVMFVPHGWWVRAAVVLTRGELIEDPDDPVATWIRDHAGSVSGSTQWFVFLYLLSHAVVKIVLVWALLRDRLWAYPWMIGVLGVFIAYQLYVVVTQGSVGMALLTVLDVLVLALTWHEWRRHRARRHRHLAGGDPRLTGGSGRS
ncbi:DUF2127 domain-containing protein [Ornithinimicrobium avium]|uniref:DUF2127 domain-containing protein n=1 Tax=Ornithinimicrobium avium TaxID=2283195 RepID=A0A345NK02_9MICO|nr:DUF2127 domain-containing protein [Ornithinimicrobium avium]AXH95360.1 DUF2127 domain-containing protein [Ornithinimicrobium avium]